MNIKQMILFFLAMLIMTPVNAQIGGGGYEAYKIKKGQREDYPIRVSVTELAWGFCWFTEKRDEPLDGTYHIIVNSNKYHTATFNKGFIDGDWEFYFYDKLSKKGTFDGGRLDGKYYSYYENGKIEMEYTYKRQEYATSLTLHHVFYHENGAVKEECFYDENGRKHGKLIQYDENGNIKKEIEYIHGKIKETK